MKTDKVRDHLQATLEELSQDQLEQMLEFAKKLRAAKQTLGNRAGGKRRVADPLGRFVGAVSVGNLATGIDDELYGPLKK